MVGSEKMAVFDDTAEHKLILYPHKVEWRNRMPTAVKANGESIDSRTASRCAPNASISSIVSSPELPRSAMARKDCGCCGYSTRVSAPCRTVRSSDLPRMHPSAKKELPYFVHESAYVDEGAVVGAGTKIWHFSHVMKGAAIGERSIIGQNVNIDGGTVIGNNVKIQNNVSVYTGTMVEDDVFLGPSCVLTNVTNPRSQVNRHSLYETTLSETRMHSRRECDHCVRN